MSRSLAGRNSCLLMSNHRTPDSTDLCFLFRRAVVKTIQTSPSDSTKPVKNRWRVHNNKGYACERREPLKLHRSVLFAHSIGSARSRRARTCWGVRCRLTFPRVLCITAGEPSSSGLTAKRAPTAVQQLRTKEAVAVV